MCCVVHATNQTPRERPPHKKIERSKIQDPNRRTYHLDRQIVTCSVVSMRHSNALPSLRYNKKKKISRHKHTQSKQSRAENAPYRRHASTHAGTLSHLASRLSSRPTRRIPTAQPALPPGGDAPLTFVSLACRSLPTAGHPECFKIYDLRDIIFICPADNMLWGGASPRLAPRHPTPYLARYALIASSAYG